MHLLPILISGFIPRYPLLLHIISGTGWIVKIRRLRSENTTAWGCGAEPVDCGFEGVLHGFVVLFDYALFFGVVVAGACEKSADQYD